MEEEEQRRRMELEQFRLEKEALRLVCTVHCVQWYIVLLTVMLRNQVNAANCDLLIVNTLGHGTGIV